MNMTSKVEPASDALWEPPFNMSDVASRSAVELDNLLLGDSKDLQATTILVQHLAEFIPEETNSVTYGMGLDTTMAVALNRAIDDSSFASHTVNTVADLATEAKKIRRALEELSSIDDGSIESAIEKIKKLRNFCIALSKRASAQGMPSQDLEPQHPFRR